MDENYFPIQRVTGSGIPVLETFVDPKEYQNYTNNIGNGHDHYIDEKYLGQKTSSVEYGGTGAVLHHGHQQQYYHGNESQHDTVQNG